MTVTEVRVRAYAVGFGDALVLTANDGQQTFRMLVDCGVHAGGPNPQHTMDAIVSDILAEAGDGAAGSHFDVIAATHRHRDHVSGFTDPRWRGVAVDEVWLPWTEDPADPEADDLRHGFDDLANALGLALAADDTGNALALNSLSNAQAMDTLLYGLEARSRCFLSTEGGPRRQPLPFPGAVAWHLGPPRQAEALRRKTAPKDERWFAEPADGAGLEGSPFDPSYRLELDEYRRLYQHLDTEPDSLARVALPATDALEVAGWLDKALNNTSLFFVVQIAGVTVLFPGDAQWGAWRHVLADERSVQLLRQVDAYKVSHHASHNGTPRTFVEDLLPSTALSLVSVRDMPQWSELPCGSLLEQLSGGERVVVRTDTPAAGATVVRHPDDLWVEIVLAGGD